jgi:hypothetical protein
MSLTKREGNGKGRKGKGTKRGTGIFVSAFSKLTKQTTLQLPYIRLIESLPLIQVVADFRHRRCLGPARCAHSYDVPPLAFVGQLLN